MHLLPIIFTSLVLAYSPVVFASKCVLAASLLFEPGAFGISAEQEKVVDRPIEKVRESNTVVAFIVVGHADSVEVSKQEQLELSLKRANSVGEYVLRAHPDLKGRVHVEGKGATQPISYTNQTVNRRADIEVICIVPPDSSGLPTK